MRYKGLNFESYFFIYKFARKFIALNVFQNHENN